MNAAPQQKVIEILVESAVLYRWDCPPKSQNRSLNRLLHSGCVILALGTYVADSNVQFVMVAAVSEFLEHFQNPPEA